MSFQGRGVGTHPPIPKSTLVLFLIYFCQNHPNPSHFWKQMRDFPHDMGFSPSKAGKHDFPLGPQKWPMYPFENSSDILKIRKKMVLLPKQGVILEMEMIKTKFLLFFNAKNTLVLFEFYNFEDQIPQPQPHPPPSIRYFQKVSNALHYLSVYWLWFQITVFQICKIRALVFIREKNNVPNSFPIAEYLAKRFQTTKSKAHLSQNKN